MKQMDLKLLLEELTVERFGPTGHTAWAEPTPQTQRQIELTKRVYMAEILGDQTEQIIERQRVLAEALDQGHLVAVKADDPSIAASAA